MIVREEDAFTLEVQGERSRTIRVFFSPLRQPGAVDGVAMGVAEVPPGVTSAPHIHDTESEYCYVIAGTGEVNIGGTVYPLAPDTAYVAPPGLTHPVSNTGSEVLKILWLYLPAGPEEVILRGAFK